MVKSDSGSRMPLSASSHFNFYSIKISSPKAKVLRVNLQYSSNNRYTVDHCQVHINFYNDNLKKNQSLYRSKEYQSLNQCHRMLKNQLCLLKVHVANLLFAICFFKLAIFKALALQIKLSIIERCPYNYLASKSNWYLLFFNCVLFSLSDFSLNNFNCWICIFYTILQSKESFDSTECVF